MFTPLVLVGLVDLSCQLSPLTLCPFVCGMTSTAVTSCVGLVVLDDSLAQRPSHVFSYLVDGKGGKGSSRCFLDRHVM